MGYFLKQYGKKVATRQPRIVRRPKIALKSAKKPMFHLEPNVRESLPFPEEDGITDKWIEEAMKKDPQVEPIVERTRPGIYEIGFFKTVEGEPVPFFMSMGLHLENILEILKNQEETFDRVDGEEIHSVKARWSKKDAEEALKPIQDDVDTYYRKYTPKDLEGMSDPELIRIAKIKAGNEMTGGIVRWNAAGTGFVNVKSAPMSIHEKRKRTIEIIVRNAHRPLS